MSFPCRRGLAAALSLLLIAAASAAAAGCATGGETPSAGSPGGAPQGAVEAPASAPVDARDVAVLVLEQTPTSLRVTSSARRPRSSFGPAAAWNGAGTPTHRWRLAGAGGETLAAGDVMARGTLEAPPNPAKGAPAVHVPQETFSFVVKVPHPAPGEAVEITAAAPASGGPALTARWP